MHAAAQKVQSRQFALSKAIGELIPIQIDCSASGRRIVDIGPFRRLSPGTFGECDDSRKRHIFETVRTAQIFAPELTLNSQHVLAA